MNELVNISRIARETGEILRSSIPNKIAIAIETAEDIPPIEADSGQMKQIIINLAMNGAEAIEKGEGRVKIRTAVESIAGEDKGSNALGYPLAPGQYALIEVSDSGCGMDERTQAQIFDPFFTTKFTGRGLGLAAVQGIVRSLEGAIQVSSARGKGSTLRVLLPVKRHGLPENEMGLAKKKPAPEPGAETVLARRTEGQIWEPE